MRTTVRVADGVTPELRRIAREIGRPRALLAGLGKELEIAFREHFMERDREPNAQGWPKRHFWRDVVRRQAALTEVTDTKAVVTVASAEFVHKVRGGTVTPKRGRALAIPRIAEAYKLGSPREADKDFLDFLPIRQRGLIGALVERQATLLRRTKKGFKSAGETMGRIWYWLVAKATHAPDPRALPDARRLDQRLLARGRAILSRTLQSRR